MLVEQGLVLRPRLEHGRVHQMLGMEFGLAH